MWKCSRIKTYAPLALTDTSYYFYSSAEGDQVAAILEAKESTTSGQKSPVKLTPKQWSSEVAASHSVVHWKFISREANPLIIAPLTIINVLLNIITVCMLLTFFLTFTTCHLGLKDIFFNLCCSIVQFLLNYTVHI